MSVVASRRMLVAMTSDTTTPASNESYRNVLRNRPVAGLLLGDLLAFVGTGMIIVAMPVQTLAIHGSVPKAVAIGLVEAAPFFLATVLALSIGLGRVAVPPRTLLLADCVLRSLTFTVLGILAITDHLTLPALIGGLLVGSTFKLAGRSSRRLLATSLVGESGRLAVNGLLGWNQSFALLIVGPALGGVIVAGFGAGVVLFAEALGAVIMLASIVASVQPDTAQPERARNRLSGWHILRQHAVASRLLIVVFFFNFLYMPIEIALPLYVRDSLDADASGLGLIWGAFGIGAAIGAVLVNQLRNLPQRHVLVAIIGLWALCPLMLAVAGNVAAAMLAFGFGGLVYAPFTPVLYSFVQSKLAPDEEQQVVTLWTTGSSLAAPLGLTLGGPFLELTGIHGGLVLSGVLTLLLVPIAIAGVCGGGSGQWADCLGDRKGGQESRSVHDDVVPSVNTSS